MADDLNQPKPIEPAGQSPKPEPAPAEPPPELVISASPSEPSPPLSVISPAPPGKKTRPKVIAGLIVIFFLLASIPAAVFLVQKTQEIREKATGNCPTGKSSGINDFANPDPGCEAQGGVYCYNSSKAYCCYNQNGDLTDGYEYCAEGIQGNCNPVGEGAICVRNGWSGEIFKIVGTNVTCPFSGPKQIIFTGTVSNGADCGDFTGKIFSLADGECGQIDGPCGSCRPGCGAQPTPTSPPTGISCNTSEISLSVSPNPAALGQTITFKITGDASTWIGDDYQGAVTNCSGTWNNNTCTASTAGTFTWTHTWKHCVGDIYNCSGTCSKSTSFTITGPTPTPTPPITAQCQLIKAYDLAWNPLTATQLSQLKTGDKVRFAVLGQTSAGTFQKARFRVNSTTWLPETTAKKPGTEEFYTEYTIPAGVTSFKVEAEVYHQTLGWQ